MAIERKILANMHRAIDDKNFKQLDKAQQLYDVLQRMVKEGEFVDYSDQIETTGSAEVSPRLDKELFTEQLQTSGLERVSHTALSRAYANDNIGRLEDLSHMADRSILLLSGIGKIGLKDIREHYPFIPKS